MTTISATYAPEDNKIRLYASSRLDSETFAKVKTAGFRWAPKQDLFFATWSPGAEDLATELAGEIEDEDKSLVDRAEERAERFEGYSENRMADAESARRAVEVIADGIPLGQPILLGHHSQRRAERDRDKIESGMRKAVKMWETSGYWAARAAGAIKAAKYKERPDVRARRIKTIEADKRKRERDKSEADMWLKLWTACGDEPDAELQKGVALRLANMCWLHLPRKEGDREDFNQQPTAYDVLTNAHPTLYAPRTIAEIVEHAKRVYPASIAYADRWIAHFENRLAYERAMLAEAGVKTDWAFAKGGRVEYKGGWLTILRVNRGAAGVVSVTCELPESLRRHGKTLMVAAEYVTGYEAPDAGDVEKARKAAKLPPLCNYPGEGFREMTETEWKAAMARKWSDFPYIGKIQAHGEVGAHRRRQMPVPGKMWEKQPVFITDGKRVDPPKLTPEPAPPAAEIDLDGTSGQDRDNYSDDQDRESYSVENEDEPKPVAVEQEEAEPAEPVSVAVERREPVAASLGAAAAPRDDGDDTLSKDQVDDIRGRLKCGEDAARLATAFGIGKATVEFLGKTGKPGPCERAENQGTVEDPPPSAENHSGHLEPANDPYQTMRDVLRAGGVKVTVASQLFPTPRELAARMIEEAGLQPGDKILEPSAGTGRLIDAAITSGWTGQCLAVEINPALASALLAKYDDARVFVHHGDFLALEPGPERFDRVVMNPPFADSADIRHVRHAARFLKPGGRLVAIMSAGVTFRQDRMSTEFRAFVESQGGTIESLPPDSFRESGTSVNAVLVVMDVE